MVLTLSLATIVIVAMFAFLRDQKHSLNVVYVRPTYIIPLKISLNVSDQIVNVFTYL